jgi:hypothetical protein
VFGTLFFNININSLDPDLHSVVVSNISTGDSCAVTVNKTIVEISQALCRALIRASAAVAAAHAATNLSSALHNTAASPDVPLAHVLMAIFYFGSLRMVVFHI